MRGNVALALLATSLLTACGGGGGGGQTPTAVEKAWVEVAAYRGSYDGSALAVAAFQFDSETGLVVFGGPSWGDGSFSCLPHEIVAVTVSRAGAVGSGQHLLSSQAQPIHARELAVADFNGDGRRDLLLGSHGCDNPPFPGERNTVLINENGTLVDHSERLPQFDAFTHSVAAADLRQVGRDDALIGIFGLAYDPNADASLYNRGNTPFADAPYFGPYLLRGNADGSLSYDTESLPDRVAKLIDGHDPSGVFTAAAFADLDGDGFADLVVGSGGNAAVAGYAYLNDRQGGFRTSEIPLPVGAFGANNTIVADIKALDLDQDGRSELLIAATSASPFYGSEKLQVLRLNGAVFDDVTADTVSFDERPGWTQFVHIVDLNGDGCDDLVMSKSDPNADDSLIFECRAGRLQPAKQPARKHSLTPLQIGGKLLLVSVKSVLAGDGTFDVRTYEYR